MLACDLDERFRPHDSGNGVFDAKLRDDLDGRVDRPTERGVYRRECYLKIVVGHEDLGLQVRERDTSAQNIELGGVLELEPRLHLIELALSGISFGLEHAQIVLREEERVSGAHGAERDLIFQTLNVAVDAAALFARRRHRVRHATEGVDRLPRFDVPHIVRKEERVERLATVERARTQPVSQLSARHHR